MTSTASKCCAPPQGTLYGRSATAGLVAISTRNPGLASLGSDAMLETGNYNLEPYIVVLNLPIVSDKLAVRVAGDLRERDGFIDAAADAFRGSDAKITLLYKPNEDISLLVGAALQGQRGPHGRGAWRTSTRHRNPPPHRATAKYSDCW